MLLQHEFQGSCISPAPCFWTEERGPLRQMSKVGRYLRLIDSCFTQLRSQVPSRTTQISSTFEEEEEEAEEEVGTSQSKMKPMLLQNRLSNGGGRVKSCLPANEIHYSNFVLLLIWSDCVAIFVGRKMLINTFSKIDLGASCRMSGACHHSTTCTNLNVSIRPDVGGCVLRFVRAKLRDCEQIRARDKLCPQPF